MRREARRGRIPSIRGEMEPGGGKEARATAAGCRVGGLGWVWKEAEGRREEPKKFDNLVHWLMGWRKPNKSRCRWKKSTLDPKLYMVEFFSCP